MGSTAVALVVHWDKEYRSAQLITANVGDSRAVLSRRGHAVDLTQVNLRGRAEWNGGWVGRAGGCF